MLTQNKKRWNRNERDQQVNAFNVGIGEEIFEGGNLYYEPATQILVKVPTATSKFMGVAQNYYKNETGATTTDKPVRVAWNATELMVNPGTITDEHIGDLVYGVTDDETITLAAGDNPIGDIVEVRSDGVMVATKHIKALL